MTFSRIIYFIAAWAIFISSCQKNTSSCPEFPHTNVYIDLHIDIPSQDPSLLGYVLIKGDNAGYGGVIIVPSYPDDSYRAFEMSAPHLPRTENTILTISSNGMYASCPADSSKFMLINGMPLYSDKKISPCGLIEYNTSYDPVNRIIHVRH